MPGFLKQSTAGQSRSLGPFVSSTDFLTTQSGLTIANTDIKLVVNGGASANKNSGGGTHRVNGVYGVTFDATDTAVVGEMEVSVVVAGALPVFDKFYVVEEAVFDALFAGSAPGYLQPATAGRTLVVDAAGLADANVVKVGPTGSGTAQTARDIGASVLLSSGTGTGQLKLASGYVAMTWADIAAPTTSVNLSGTTIATTQKVDVETIKTNPVVNAGTVTFPTTATLASTTNITAGTVTTATNVTTVNGLAANVITAASTAADYLAEINAEVDTAIADAALATAANLATVDAVVDAILVDTNELQTDWANGGRLDLILDARASQSSVDTIDGIVDSILVDTAEIGAAGAGLTAIPWNAAWDAEVQSEATDALNAYDPPTNAEMVARTLAAADYATATALATVDTVVDAIKVTTDKLDDTVELTTDGYIFTANALEQAPTGGSAPSAADIADAVWEEAIADHSGTAGSTAEALAAAGSAGDPWITALPGGYTAGQAGYIVGTNINATISSRATQTSVDDLPTNAELATALGTADDAVLTAIGDLPTNAELATALGTADDAVLAAIDALPTATENADALLNRDMSAVSDTNSRSPLNALRFVRNGFSIAGSTLTVLKEDDVTPAFTRDLTTDPAADPITGVS